LSKNKYNFIDGCADAIMSLSDDMDINMAYACAHALLGSVTWDKIFLRTHKGDLSADIMVMVLATSGAGKTLAYKPVKEIVKNMGLLIPATFTTESLSDYFAQRNIEKDENGEPMSDEDGKPVYGEHIHPNYGLIPWDEASKHFSESRAKKHMSGIIELLSAVYNHSFDSSYYKSYAEIEFPQDPYVSLLGNMVSEYFTNIPAYFFVQGIAGRIHWVYVEPRRPKTLEEQADWNNTENYQKGQKELKEIEKQLNELNDGLRNLSKPIILKLNDEANTLIREFKVETELESFSNYKNNESGVDYQYLNRLPEMAAKAALRYAIADNIDDVEKLKEINKEQMKRGIDFARKSNEALQVLFTLNNRGSGISKKLKAYTALFKAENGMLTNSQWRKASGISSPNTFQKITEQLIEDGSVKTVDKSTITDEDEKDRLKVGTPSKVYKAIMGK
jgi:hypothetical protein